MSRCKKCGRVFQGYSSADVVSCSSCTKLFSDSEAKHLIARYLQDAIPYL